MIGKILEINVEKQTGYIVGKDNIIYFFNFKNISNLFDLELYKEVNFDAGNGNKGVYAKNIKIYNVINAEKEKNIENNHVKPKHAINMPPKNKPNFFDINGQSVLLKDVKDFKFKSEPIYLDSKNEHIKGESGVTDIFFNVYINGIRYFLAKDTISSNTIYRRSYETNNGYYSTSYPKLYEIDQKSLYGYKKAQKIF